MAKVFSGATVDCDTCDHMHYNMYDDDGCCGLDRCEYRKYNPIRGISCVVLFWGSVFVLICTLGRL